MYNMELKKLGYSDQIYEILRQRIVTLSLPPGRKIDIGKLSREFNVSATPIREALKRLVERGLVRYRKDTGYWVVPLTDKDVQDIFVLRKVLETFALNESIHSIWLWEIEGLLKDSRQLLAGDVSESELRKIFDEMDELLHYRLIVGRCKNEFLKTFYTIMNDYIAIVRHLNERIMAAVEEHIEILEALKRGDLEAAKVSLARHLDSSAQACRPLPRSVEEWEVALEEVSIKKKEV